MAEKNGKRYFVILGTRFEGIFPGLVPRTLADAERELQECNRTGVHAYLTEVKKEAKGKRIEDYNPTNSDGS